VSTLPTDRQAFHHPGNIFKERFLSIEIMTALKLQAQI
jgi:hypothetical protein